MPNLGLIGLGMMGRNLALNLASQNHPLVAYSYDTGETERLRQGAGADGIVIPDNLDAMIESLAKPRTVLLMVTAGAAVDEVIHDLVERLDPGDVIVDGGNSFYEDTRRRADALREKGIDYLGVGISGGQEGARHGASIMAGGSERAFEVLAPVFVKLSAQVAGKSCCALLGSDGAGHFVKMVHNGIEYALMQSIAEVWDFLERGLGWSRDEQQAAFAKWADGPTGSFLVEITCDILAFSESDGYLLDRISDRAGQKGTGRWTVDAAMRLAVPTPSINAAVTERYLSTLKAERGAAARGASSASSDNSIDGPRVLEQALLGAMIAAFAQGFALIRAASNEYGWNTPLAEVARSWRGGCIVRAAILEDIESAFEADAGLVNLMLSPIIRGHLATCDAGLRAFVANAVHHGIPAPVTAAGLAYIDSYHSAKLPTNLVQAQRDYFGAHTYERDDKEGSFHTNWKKM